MKKTLVALAALAATGAFAQVTITGTLAYGYLQTTTSGVDASGFGIDTSALNFNAAEDLGAGSKVTALIGFDGVSRSAANGGDVVLGYSTPAYSLSMSTTYGADYLTGGIAAVGNKGLDNAITSARGSNDAVSISVPVTSAVKVGFSHVEGAKASTASTYVIGAGAAGADVGEQRRNMVTVDYAAGALVANVGFGAYDSYGNVATSFKSITRGSVSYDLGVAKLGAGIDQRIYVTGTRTDSALGVMVPMGNFSAGALWASRTYNDTNDATKDGTRNGYSLRLNYALSKLTAVTFDYQNYKRAFADNANSSSTELYLTKNF